MEGASVISQATLNAAASAVADVTLPTALRQLMSSAARLTDVRLEQRSAAGALLGVGAGTSGAGQTGSGSASKPFQTSCVISLRTANPTRSGRGRLYWPALGAVIGSDSLRLVTPATETVGTAAQTYFRAVREALQLALELPNLPLAVHSQKYAVDYPVTDYEIGDVLDVQRRRRDKAVENRYTTVV